jgi:hypothetical protein
MTSHALPNFSRPEEAVRIAEVFYARAADICQVNARRTQQPRDQQFLEHIADRTRNLGAALAQQRNARPDAVLETWVQYTPEQPLPGESELAELESQGASAEATVDRLREATDRWSSIYAHLQDEAPTAEGKEVLGAYKQLLDAWNESLNRALHESRDL